MPLVIPFKPDFERDAVAREWERQYDSVLRLDRFWEVPDGLNVSQTELYGNDTFCLVVAQKLGLELLTPDERLIASASHHLTRRVIRHVTLDEALRSKFPVFAKPALPKEFRGAVYDSPDALQRELRSCLLRRRSCSRTLWSFAPRPARSHWMALSAAAASTRATVTPTWQRSMLNS